MMFLNGIAMIALTALAVPVIIHLRQQRKAKVVDWAAMQFLTRSLVNRRHGLALEHLLLLLCRCLLIAMFVLAMSRPQISSGSDLRWLASLTLGLFGLTVLAWAVVVRSRPWIRITAATVAVILISSVATLGTLATHSLTQWDQPRDVAIVIDASSSMKVDVDGLSNFQRAREEASLLVESLPGGSTASVMLAGPVLTRPAPTQANLRRVSENLSELKETGGGTNLHLAIEQSRLALENSPNALKQIVVFSDNQLRPWQKTADQAALEPNSTASGTDGQADGESDDLSNSETEPELYCRAFPLPNKLLDASVTNLKLDADTVSIHQPLGIVAELLNGGTESIRNLELELLVNDKVIQVEPVQELKGNVRTSVRFKHRFDRPGWNTVSARIKGTDHLPDNNVIHHVVHVAADLPVLIVNGNSSDQSFRRPATFMQMALDPNSMQEPGNAKERTSQLTRVHAIDAAEIGLVPSFFDYQVILLCDVPRLPSEVADQVAEFVERGGGLWVLPGERCQSEFYNNWAAASSGEMLLPMQLMHRTRKDSGRDNPLELDFDSITHVTLAPLVETGRHDLSELQVSAHWKLGDWPTHQPALVAARLTNGDPLLVEHSVGRGTVLVTAISADSLESNFIGRASFPVLTHLWVEYLAGSHAIDLNYQPQSNLLVQLDASEFPTGQPLALESPFGNKRLTEAAVLGAEEQLLVEVGPVATPGLYQLAAATLPDETTIPFTVLGDEDEFDLTAAPEGRLTDLGEDLLINWISEIEQIEKIARGSFEAVELWRFFAVGALAMLVLEVIVMRWIAWRRHAASTLDENKTAYVTLPQSTSLLQPGAGVASGDIGTPSSGISARPLTEAVR